MLAVAHVTYGAEQEFGCIMFFVHFVKYTVNYDKTLTFRTNRKIAKCIIVRELTVAKFGQRRRNMELFKCAAIGKRACT